MRCLKGRIHGSSLREDAGRTESALHELTHFTDPCAGCQECRQKQIGAAVHPLGVSDFGDPGLASGLPCHPSSHRCPGRARRRGRGAFAILSPSLFSRKQPFWQYLDSRRVGAKARDSVAPTVTPSAGWDLSVRKGLWGSHSPSDPCSGSPCRVETQGSGGGSEEPWREYSSPL